MSEIWEKIPNASKYEVSNTGEVRSWNTQRGGWASSPSLMKKKLNKKVGYYNVGITYDDGVQKTRYVHRLVAEAFLGYRDNSLVRHLNDDRLDNRVENLAWGTQRQNMSDAILNGKLPTGTKCSKSVLSERDIILIARMDKEGLTRATIARIIGVHVGIINSLLRGKTYKYDY
jgi:hypothetical protein